MERLWTPWRMGYVAGEKPVGCPFCTALDNPGRPDSLIVYNGTENFVIMNLFPYNSGHMMVVPHDHVASTEDLGSTARTEMFELANFSMSAARTALRCDGFNLGMNVGPVSGAGIAEHAHLHIVPRWFGDTNFMPLLAGTKVLPELLLVSRARIRGELETSLAAAEDQSLVLTAGAIVFDEEENAIVLRRTANDEIVIPKGKIEIGETTAEAALREITEETGYQAAITGWAGSGTFEIDSGQRVHVVYFLATGAQGIDTPKHLKTDTFLAPLDDAAGMASFDDHRYLLTNAVRYFKATERTE